MQKCQGLSRISPSHFANTSRTSIFPVTAAVISDDALEPVVWLSEHEPTRAKQIKWLCHCQTNQLLTPRAVFAMLAVEEEPNAMNTQLEGNPDYGEVAVTLGPGEAFWAESGAMSRMSSDLELKGRLIGGFFKALIRKLVGGESLFIAEYTAFKEGQLYVAPTYPGTVLHRKLRGESFFLTAGSFLGCTPGLTLRTRFGGLKAFFSGEGAFFIECAGEGDVFFNSFGGVIEKELDGNLTVDTGHLVAWEPTLEYSIGGMGSLKSTLFSGEGLVMKFNGRGKLYLQTRTPPSLVKWVVPFLRG